MIAIPFVYFSLLACFFYMRNKRNLNLPVYILLIYAISGLFAILIDVFGLRSIDTQNYTISLKASFIYCFCITIVILPLVYSSKNLSLLSPIKINDGVLRGGARFSVLFAVFYITMSIPDMLSVLYGNIGDMRSDIYSGLGNTLWYEKMTATARLPIMILKSILGVPWIMMFIAFFFKVVQKMPTKYSVMLIMASLIGPVDGIMGVDRSQVTYWIISLVGVYIFFRPYLNNKQRKQCVKIGFVLIAVLTIYLAMVTISRFGDNMGATSMGGSSTSLISYLGQPYINFCFFYDNFIHRVYNPAIIMPFTSQYLLLGGLGTGTQFQAYLTWRSGYNVGVFYTFLGAIYLAMDSWILYIYCLVIFLFATMLLRNGSRTYSLHKSYIYCMFATVPMLGIFTHYYSYSTNTFSAIFFYILTFSISHLHSKKS